MPIFRIFEILESGEEVELSDDYFLCKDGEVIYIKEHYGEEVVLGTFHGKTIIKFTS